MYVTDELNWPKTRVIPVGRVKGNYTKRKRTWHHWKQLFCVVHPNLLHGVGTGAFSLHKIRV